MSLSYVSMDVDDHEAESSLFTLSQPELLSKDAIISVLREKGVNVYEYEEKDKDELINKYYAIACPLPQRKYRKNRRGKEMVKSQIQVSKRKRTYDQMKESDQGKSNSYTIASSSGNQMTSNMSKSGFINQFEFLSSCGNRIKPPPIRIDPDKKIVRLGSGRRSGEIKKTVSNERARIIFEKQTPGKVQIKTPEKVQIKTPPKSNLEHIVIHSSFKKKNEVNSNGVELKKAQSESFPKESVKQISVLKTSPGTRIKLKRNNKITIPRTDDVPKQCTDDVPKQCNDEIYKTEESCTVSPVDKHKTNITSPKQRQINLINNTLKERAVLDQENPECTSSKQEDEDGVVTKKFRSISITWP